jgi:hypothetical protein
MTGRALTALQGAATDEHYGPCHIEACMCAQQTKEPRKLHGNLSSPLAYAMSFMPLPWLAVTRQ